VFVNYLQTGLDWIKPSSHASVHNISLHSMTSAGNLIFGISAENHLRHRTGIMWSSHIYAIHSGIYFVIYFC